ncbi:MAG TPA: adenylate/guanylate cyclase domain-containing protein [Herpetosiphonaceae bacterium]|nr:adenylate/guanylate cyclase domain-containing protein [Herpetosiphonaceae bacterium]
MTNDFGATAGGAGGLRSQLEATQVLAVRMTTLNRLASEMNSIDDLELVLRIVATQGRWLLDFDACALALSDHAGHVTLRMLAPYDYPLYSVLPQSDWAGSLAESRTMALALDGDGAAAMLAPAVDLGLARLSSALIIPLRSGSVYEGTLLLGRGAADAFTSDDVHIAHLFGALLGATLQRTRLAFRLRNEHANLSTLYQTLAELASTTTVDELLERLVQIGVLNTGAQRGATIQLDVASGRPLRAIGWPQSLDGADPAELLRHGLFGRVIASRQPLLLANAPADPGWTAPAADERDTHSVLTVPLSHHGTVSGLLSVTHDEFGAFDEGHLAMLMTLAQQAAIMLENVRLAEQQRRLFHQYVSTNVAAELLRDPTLASLGGVRQVVTVVFADLVNFTAFAEARQPEALIAVLNTYLGLAAEAVLEFGGTLDKFMGDAVMAIFNAPQEQPDHVLCAARAALRIQQLVAGYHDLVDGGLRLAFRVGIHTGEAVVGNIGAQALRNYTAVGDAVNIAKRIQEHAAAGEVLISESTRAALGGLASAEWAATAALKGKSAPMPLYRLDGVRT